MSILQLPTPLPSQVGILPATKKMVSTDNLATITTAGYLNAVNLEAYPISASDILEVLYSYNQQTNSGTFGIFTPSITNGVITLVASVSPGNVLLPVVSGDFAVFNGTTGQIKDSAQAPTNAASPFVVTSPGSLTIGNFPKLADAKGTLAAGLPPSAAANAFVVVSPGSLTIGNFPKLGDANGTITTGLPPSASGNSFVVVSPGSMTIGHLLSAGDANGTLADSGLVGSNVMLLSASNTLTGTGRITAVKANGTEAANAVTASGMAGIITTSSLTTAGAASYAITWTNTYITATSVIQLTIMGGTNTTQNVTLVATNGVGTSTLTIYNNTAATSLNGTIFIGYLVM